MPKPKRKKYSEEEIAEREARKARVRELAQRVADLTPEQRQEMALRAGIRTIEGHEVSVKNACLLMHQLDGVSVVGGFHQWIKAGRVVCSGKNSGLSIWAPRFRKDEETDQEKQTGFVGITVFDISQTKPLSEETPEWNETTREVTAAVQRIATAPAVIDGAFQLEIA